jgi:hypothetical protein
MCTEHVPFRYLFSAKHHRNRATVSALLAQPEGRVNDPSLQALQRAAKGWVGEYGLPAASDATDGANAAKKRNPGRTPYRTFLSTIDLEENTALSVT